MKFLKSIDVLWSVVKRSHYLQLHLLLLFFTVALWGQIRFVCLCQWLLLARKRQKNNFILLSDWDLKNVAPPSLIGILTTTLKFWYYYPVKSIFINIDFQNYLDEIQKKMWPIHSFTKQRHRYKRNYERKYFVSS